MAHIQEILRALHLDTMHTEYYSFRSKDASPKVQIDLVIDRSDDFVDIIEIKFSRISFGMTKEESEKNERAVSRFINKTKTRKGVQTDLLNHTSAPTLFCLAHQEGLQMLAAPLFP